MEKTHGKLLIYTAAISVNVLSFSAGVASSWPSPSLPKLSSNDTQTNPLLRPTTILENSWIVAILSLGCIIGSLSSGMASSAFGRKTTLIMFTLPMILCYVLIALARNVEVLYIARLLLGIGSGCVYSVVPSYVGEISEDSDRGFFGNFMGLSLSLGNAFSQTVGPLVTVQMFSIFQLVALAVVFLTFVPFAPESPYYLLSINDRQRAEQSLCRLRGKSGPDVNKELLYIEERMEESRANALSLAEFLKSVALRRSLVITMGLMVVQHCCGICAILAYMQTIFESAESLIHPEISLITVNIFQIAFMFIATLLVDRLGRKLLLLISIASVSMSLVSLGTYFYLADSDFDTSKIFWLPLLSLVSFCACFNLGIASIPWILCGELFPPNVKAIAAGVATCVSATGAFGVTMAFPYMAILLGMAGSFWFFAVCAGVGFVFVFIMLPETKGKSFLEIEMMLSRQKKV